MESGQAELAVLWAAWVERFSGRRVSAALSFLLGASHRRGRLDTSGPAVGMTVAARVFGCFVFLVAFAMAHEQVVEAAGTNTPTGHQRPAPSSPRVACRPPSRTSLRNTRHASPTEVVHTSADA